MRKFSAAFTVSLVVLVGLSSVGQAWAGVVGSATAASGSAVTALAPAAAATVSAVPRPDHVVVVVEENHSNESIIGNISAPYINSLAARGANMTQSYAVTHPSQPNYIALFSGSTNGIIDDSCPHTINADNLGAQLLTAGLSFAGYSETMPAAGFTGCGSTTYARKHNPWVNFPSVPASANLPLTAFTALSADYAALPAVSFVVPNLQNDMHDGTIAQGDSWLQSNLGGYVDWAEQHNSLMILTWDEDDNRAANRIPTIILGAGVAPGAYPEHIDHYSILRTIQDAYGLPAIGASATATPILDIWTPPIGSPQAAMTVSCAALVCSADAAASTPGTGTITGYSWNWGDGTAVTSGVSSSHTYAGPGDYQLGLTVVTDTGGSSSAGRTVSPRLPVDPNLFASDSFSRTLSNSLGSADIGGAWTGSGPAARYSVSGGLGSVVFPTAGGTLAATLATVSRSDTDLQLSFGTDKLATGNGMYVTLIGRRVAVNTEYQASVRIRGDGAVITSLNALKGTATSVALTGSVIVSGLTVTAGALLNARLQVTGTNPTTVRLKVWAATGTEPANWQLSATDSFAGAQGPGSIGVSSYLSGGSTNAPVVLRMDNLSARTTAAAPVNVPPAAALSVSCTNLVCAADSAGSVDPDGSIAGFSWSWGDGSAASTGATSSHTYGSAGSYVVTVTATDNQGGVGTAYRTVTPTAAPGSPFATDTFSRTVSNGWGAATLGGAWTVSGGATNFSVAGGAGLVTVPKPGATVAGNLLGVSSADTDYRLSMSTDKLGAGSGTYFTASARRVGTNLEYQGRARVNGSGQVFLGLNALTGTSTVAVLSAAILVPGLTAVAGGALTMRVQVTGTNPTTVRAKVWSAAGAEPAGWQLSATDSTAALQAPGAIGFNVYLSSTSVNAPITVRLTDLSARPVGGP